MAYLYLSDEFPYVLTSSHCINSHYLFLPPPLFKYCSYQLICLIHRHLSVDPSYRNGVRRYELILETNLRGELRILHQILSKVHQYGIEGNSAIEEGEDEEKESELRVGQGVGQGQEVHGRCEH